MTWTKAADDQPGDERIVLIVLANEDDEPIWLGYYNIYHDQWYTDDSVSVDVTHWQYLPPLPEDELNGHQSSLSE